MAITLTIPERGAIELHHAVFDVNGTLAVDGIAIPGVAERLQTLAEQIDIHLLSAGTHGHLPELEQTLGFPITEIHRGEEKLRYVQQLKPMHVVVFGNGVNDSNILRLASIGIAVLTPEGTATRAWQASDILVYGPINALDLLLKPDRLIATLRG